MNDNPKNFNEQNIINFFTAKIFIYALIASSLTTYFLLNYEKYKYIFEPQLSFVYLEIIVAVLIWLVYVLLERPSLEFNDKNNFKFAIGYALWMFPITLIIKLVNHTSQTPFGNLKINSEYFSRDLTHILKDVFLTVTLYRIFIIFLFIITANVLIKLFIILFRKIYFECKKIYKIILNIEN